MGLHELEVSQVNIVSSRLCCYTLLHSETLFQKEKKKEEAKRITLNAFSLHLWKPHPFQARRHPKLLSPRQQSASWELVLRRRHVPRWLRPDALPGATLRASPLNLHSPFRGYWDRGISSFFFREAEFPLAIHIAAVGPFVARPDKYVMLRVSW